MNEIDRFIGIAFVVPIFVPFEFIIICIIELLPYLFIKVSHLTYWLDRQKTVQCQKKGIFT